MVILKDGGTSRLSASLAQSLLGSVSCLAARPHALKLASLTFKNLWDVDLQQVYRFHLPLLNKAEEARDARRGRATN